MFRERLVKFEKDLQARMAEFKCPVHLCLGHESVSEGLSKVLKPEDWVFSNHRNHGHYLAKGGSPEKLLDEILGLPSGVNEGFMGSMGVIDPSINFYAGSMVAGTVGIGVGTAYGLKNQGKEGKVIIVCGDGATDEGVFWESVNFIALHKLPVLLIVENNEYSIHVHQSERMKTPIGHRIRAFGLSGVTTDNPIKEIEHGYNCVPYFVEAQLKRECNHSNQMQDFREVR